MWTHCPALDRVVGLMMKKVILPADTAQYTGLVKNEISLLRTKMGSDCITLNYRMARINPNPVLVIDFSATGDDCTPCVMICRREHLCKIHGVCRKFCF
ncbi:hypothetical protein RD100_002064 [Salmonella enterica]|uniref:hypothetical protein n=1 Tax=Salmonella enterica TaxID=28901 RepID=UPI001131B132|nr:hypothetical protein [Salmonella enterica]ECI2308356.1 hypothetical protein [Salmonella enterica subsp. enterica serovar Infantis]ECJ5701875.1 hypothetical protein [Salmonella enterica subsp. enterica]EDV5095201.1 hypothetical protein [Salmonella enterica subsp. salamae]EIQ6622070.1 hypothetical protein [Salmonella enterica subsp. enterica serovar Muenchen]QVB41870.1 hypothetical protein JYM68_04160 [Salmonella enterica subsp. enterica serovar Saintpaul]